MRLNGSDPESNASRQIDAGPGEGRREARWMVKAFCDLQINGFAGVDFNSPSVDAADYLRAAQALWATGVTRFCPTIITAPHDSMCLCLKAAAAAAADPIVGPSIIGIHVEGPYISPEDGPRGAHPREDVRPPDRAEFERLQQAAAGRIRLLTLAPETRDAAPFTAWLCAQGIVVAIGHTAADAGQIAAVVDAGAQMSTHLGNGATEMIHRHHNILWEQLAADRLSASFIVDGHHLPPAMVKSLVRAKGIARSLLVTDAVAPAGCPPGNYCLGSQDVELTAEGRVHLRGSRRLAGSALRMDTAVSNVVRFAGVSLAEAVRMAGPQPAAILGREFPNDHVLLDQDGDRLRVRAVVREGELLWTDSSATAKT